MLLEETGAPRGLHNKLHTERVHHPFRLSNPWPSCCEAAVLTTSPARRNAKQLYLNSRYYHPIPTGCFCSSWFYAFLCSDMRINRKPSCLYDFSSGLLSSWRISQRCSSMPLDGLVTLNSPWRWKGVCMSLCMVPSDCLWPWLTE